MSHETTVTKETVLKISKLARIGISEQDIPALSKEMGHILNWINLLNTIDTTSIPPLLTPLQDLGTLQTLREDRVTDGNIVEKILSNAPEACFNMFVVPKVVE